MKLRIFSLCLIVALAACHRNSSSAPKAKPAPSPKAPVAAKPGPTLQELTAGMVEAVTQGKSQAPVLLKFELQQRPVQGQPLEVDIALLPRIAASPATIQVTGSDGLQVATEDNRIEFPAVEASQVYRHSIKLTPTAEGICLLTLSVSLKHDQLDDSRVFSVPIIVGNDLGAAPGSATGAPAAAPPTQQPRAALQQAGPPDPIAQPTASLQH
jgi:hypothetical protein